jgi:hypothetical protein
MNKTIRTNRTIRTIIRSTYKLPKEPLILVGPEGSIRSDTDLGYIHVSKLPENIEIDGCDWKGALSIYRYLKQTHSAIFCNEVHFFSKSITPDNCLFLIIFHHIYNLGLLKEPWVFPPFRTSIESKLKYLAMFLKHNPEPFSIEHDELISTIQKTLRLTLFKDWSDFCSYCIELDNKPLAENTIDAISFIDDVYRLEKLATNCRNGSEILDFLKSPIDSTKILLNIEYDEELNDNILDELCILVLDKLDQHSIYLQTGIAPINIDWLRKLDLIISK